MKWKEVEFSEIEGLIFDKIDHNDEEVTFYARSGERFRMSHHQSCCENVYLAEVVGYWDDLLDSIVVFAEKVSEDGTKNPPSEYSGESATWTFYKISTNKGSVTLRWYGSSNGSYSEDVDFEEAVL